MVSRLIRTRYGMLAMPTSLKRGNLQELEAADVNALVASAGLQCTRSGCGTEATIAVIRVEAARIRARAARRPTDHDRRTRAAPGARMARASRTRRVTPAATPQAPTRKADEATSWTAQRLRRAAFPVARASIRPVRDRRARRGAGPKHRNNDRPPRDDAQPAGPGPGNTQRPQRPPRTQHNFDEVQPQSNANASPFGRSTLSVPGGAPRGYGNEGAPATSQRTARAAREIRQAEWRRAGRSVRWRPESSRAGTAGIQGTRPRPASATACTATVDGNVAPRSEANGNVAPKAEVNGNVAPPGEKNRVMPDDDRQPDRAARLSTPSAKPRRPFVEERADALGEVVGRGAAGEALGLGVKLLRQRTSRRFAQQSLHVAERECRAGCDRLCHGAALSPPALRRRRRD